MVAMAALQDILQQAVENLYVYRHLTGSWMNFMVISRTVAMAACKDHITIKSSLFVAAK